MPSTISPEEFRKLSALERWKLFFSLDKKKYDALAKAARKGQKRTAGGARKRKKKLTAAEREKRMVQRAVKIIGRNGFYSTTLKGLLGWKGSKNPRIGPKNREEVHEILSAHGLYCYPLPDSLDNAKDRLRIYEFPVEQLGPSLFDKEKHLEEFVEKNQSYTQLGLTPVPRAVFQESLDRSNKIPDLVGRGREGEYVVVEFKREAGDRGAVHQVFEYMGYLKVKYPGAKVRGILVTGVRDYETAAVIYGMGQETTKSFQWYVYRYDPGTKKSEPTLGFEEVTYDFIASEIRARKQ